MDRFFHITTVREWEEAKRVGYYEAPSLATEGFIHCSEAHQVQGVLDRYFKGQTSLVKLEIDPTKLTSRLVREWSPSTREKYPHVYGRINLDAVTSFASLPRPG